VCAAVEAAVVPGVKWVPPLCSATHGFVYVRSAWRLLNLWLQIDALEWLHDCCHLVFPCA